MVVNCDDIQVFILPEAWSLPRKEPGRIHFMVRDIGWFNLDLEDGADAAVGS